jgi:hypothetical protein
MTPTQQAIARFRQSAAQIERDVRLSELTDEEIGALVSAACEPGEGWQPIATAPKMRGVLLWADVSTRDYKNWKMGSGYFHSGMEAWIWEGETVRDWAFPPTHWRPLPAPPEAISAMGGGAA